MKCDLDLVINHRNTNSLKWDLNEAYFGDADVLSMWVADMDFLVPQEVTDALVQRARYGVYGYSHCMDTYYQAVMAWLAKRHGWEIEKDWICFSPGVVPALTWLVRAFARPGEKVLLQSPVYPPFFSAIKNNGCLVVNNQLKLVNGQYEMDFTDFEAKLATGVKLFFLCSPHNPVGRVWRQEELQRVGELCLRYGVIVVADEIHFDLIYQGHKHTVFSSICQDFAQNSILCTAPSKTFNMAGLQISNLIIANSKLRSAFVRIMESNGINRPNTFGITAMEAAYSCGEFWLEQVLDYLEGNLEFLKGYLDIRLPEVKLVRPQGTYLVWLDFRGLGLPANNLKRLLLEQGKVALNDGQSFGPGGEGFQRMNIACPRAVLEDGLRRIETALRGK